MIKFQVSSTSQNSHFLHFFKSSCDSYLSLGGETSAEQQSSSLKLCFNILFKYPIVFELFPQQVIIPDSSEIAFLEKILIFFQNFKTPWLCNVNEMLLFAHPTTLSYKPGSKSPPVVVATISSFSVIVWEHFSSSFFS